MKKILLATTMLASVAGYAAADVAVSGDGRMGVVSTDGNSVFENRVRVKFSGSGTTDGGLSFGGSFRANEAIVAAGDEAGNKGSVFISGAFGKITFGSVDSGDAAAVGQLSSVGYEGLGSGNSIGYAADGNEVAFDHFKAEFEDTAGAKVLYGYSAGAVSVYASTAQLSNGGANATAYGVGVAYSAGAVTAALGYGNQGIEGEDGSGDITDISASVKYAMGDTTIKAIYQDKTASAEIDGDNVDLFQAVSMGASVDQQMGSLKLTAYAITTKLSSDMAEHDLSVNRSGLGVSYDLGGGATVQAGVANVEFLKDSDAEIHSQSAFDAGVNFSF
ncbi:MAG: porin [Pseudomonadota bacterium]